MSHLHQQPATSNINIEHHTVNYLAINLNRENFPVRCELSATGHNNRIATTTMFGRPNALSVPLTDYADAQIEEKRSTRREDK